MKVLFIDHHFRQDMQALIAAFKAPCEFRYISAGYFAQKARKLLPEPIFNGDLAEYHKSEYSLARKQWAGAASKVLYGIYQVYPFDIIIAPSDTFFYIRDMVSASRKLGVPFIVVQKETTIAPFSMDSDAKYFGELFPFVSDYMTVCSKRHKQFWIEAGTTSDKIEVIGQPRFDFYRKPQHWRSLKEIGISLDPKRKTILFFTYELNAYSPNEVRIWQDLRTSTEEVLANIARRNGHNVIVKPHPQHSLEDIKKFSSRLRVLAGPAWQKSIVVVDRQVDARQLIVNADIVVAFQTTALLESLAVGKRVLYTYWSQAERLSSSILPFHQYSDILECIRSREELEQAILQQGKPVEKEMMDKRMVLFNEYLGPLDGKASDRTWQAIERFISSRPPLKPEQIRLQTSLKSKSRFYCHTEILSSAAFKFFWQGLQVFAKMLRTKSIATKIAKRIERQKRRISECTNALGRSSAHSFELIGHIDEALLDLLRNRLTNHWF